MVGDFLQKLQDARQEFEDGKTIVEILFSDNPGITNPKAIVKPRYYLLVQEYGKDPRTGAPDYTSERRLVYTMPTQQHLAHARITKNIKSGVLCYWYTKSSRSGWQAKDLTRAGWKHTTILHWE